MSFNRGAHSYKPIVSARLFILRIACPTLLQITLFEILVKCCSPFIFIYVIYIHKECFCDAFAQTNKLYSLWQRALQNKHIQLPEFMYRLWKIVCRFVWVGCWIQWMQRQLKRVRMAGSLFWPLQRLRYWKVLRQHLFIATNRFVVV